MNDFELLRDLRSCNRPAEPAADLWPAIAARIDSSKALRVRAAMWPEALAASVLLGLGLLAMVAGTLRETWDAPRTNAGIPWSVREAHALDTSYASALAETRRNLPPAIAAQIAANRDLDNAQRAIEDALLRDPDARHLLDLLRRTHDRRLRMAQRQTRLG